MRNQKIFSKFGKLYIGKGGLPTYEVQNSNM